MTVRRLLIVAILIAAAALALQAGAANAAWRAPDIAGVGAAGAQHLPAGSQPSAVASARSVDVSWDAATDAPDGSSYRVVRTPAAGGAATTVCADVNETSCTDTDVPTGSWRYAVRVILGAWAGPAGDTSSSMTIGAAALSLSPSSVSALPATTTATLSGFTASETVTFRLDSPSGTVLATSPATTTTSAAGAATATVTIPSSTSTGAHTIHAIAADGLSATATLTVSLPASSLALTSTTFATLPATTTATVAAFRPAEAITFRLDSATGTSIGTATANASGAATSSVTVPAGTTSGAHTVYAVGAAGSSATRAVTVSALGASPSALAFTNGSTSRQPDRNDTVTMTYSRELQPRSVCSAWSATSGSASTTGTVRIFTPAGGHNTLEVTAMSGCTTFAVGSIDFGRTNMTSTSGTVLTYSATIAWSRTSRRITITLTSNATATGGSLLRLSSGNTAVATLTPSTALLALSGAAVTGTFSTGAIVPF